MDAVFLDFAKAFDKANHRTLQEKEAKQNFKDKVGRWIKDFITEDSG